MPDDDLILTPPPVVKFALSQAEVDIGKIRATLNFRPVVDAELQEIVRRIRVTTDRKLTVALVAFYNANDRWPAWSWVEDWRPALRVHHALDSPISIPIPDVAVGDVLPDEWVTATYQSDVLNHDENLAVDVLRSVAILK